MADESATVRDSILYLLRDFHAQIPPDFLGVVPSGQPRVENSFTEPEWLAHLELNFVCLALRMELLRSLGRCVGAIGSDAAVPAPSSSIAVREALSLVEKLLQELATRETERLPKDPNKHPLVLKLAQRYGLSPAETCLFQLLFVRGASKAPAVRAALGGRQEDKEMAMDLCGMSLMELEEFLDDKRTHMVEGIIMGQDDYDGKTFRMVKEAVSVLRLRPIKTEQWLKLSKTEVLNVVDSSHLEGKGDALVAAEDPENEVAVSAVSGQGANKKRKFEDIESITGLSGKQVDELLAGTEPVKSSKKVSLPAEQESEMIPAVETSDAQTTVEKASKGDLQAYASSLEYLDDAFQMLALMLRVAKARHKEDMKEAFNDERSWYDSYRSTKAASIRELQAKLRFAKNRLQERMRLTEEAVKQDKGQLPRLEALALKLGLDEFEKGVVLMLTAVSISPVVKSIFEGDNGDTGFRRSSDYVQRGLSGLQVQDILTVYFNSFKEQVLARTYFYKSSRLVSRGLIKLRNAVYNRARCDLMDQQVELDRRMLDWIVGLDTEMNELVDGSYLYTPKIPMDQVVLPEEQKNMLLKTVENFSKFKDFRKSAGLEDIMSYAAGLVILLCGASGTGKTMTVNAVAHHLGKRVLLVDFRALHLSGREDNSGDIRGLFRDADMNDAVIFFDECEAIFAQREHGGDKMLNALLTEMERHEGIVMLATNRPQDLDEAMHRRITCVSEFHPPDHTQRREIWKLSCSRLPMTSNIDWDRISLRYELTGGYIKNAVVSSLLIAISRDSANPIVSEEDIVEGCRLQMRGSLQMKSFTHRVVPKAGVDDLVLCTAMRERIEGILKFEKARAILQGQWGFQQERLGTACLFYGSHGTGKSAVAEAIGFELGRPLKVINCSQLISRESSAKTSANITSVFKDARLMDAVLVLEDFQIMGSEEEGIGNGLTSISAWSHVAIGLLLHELERFPGICLLVANVSKGSAIVRLDPELVRRLRFVVEFKMPDQSIRAAMWKKMLPAKAPLAADIDFDELSKRFNFTSGAISSATVRAAAKAALRSSDASRIGQKDLVEAAEAEKEHLRDESREIMMRAFI
ncbi:uncharacterized protein LOC112341471 isoform X1 [Selaginella moellendorffii]|uniref:uncharacterized protein LOC112341471 isoform X1 n=1 Tax=Selaginella moellendorffii TaxID=88036 RepID=UPI000D1C9C38|nr:uncharacterized protein LOC112341471 isoform X1 [Selaginella moellendorffii]|eukprot:XP_024517371.1 uncharacterized protein LOC112341471 isoform X1 [Selaginella moellendorffii]